MAGDKKKQEQRRLRRFRLIYHLRVFEEGTGEMLGYVGDVSDSGLLVVHEGPIEQNKTFDLLLEVPLDDGDRGRIAVTARSIWSRHDRNPDFLNTGFELINPSLQMLAGVKAMVEELGREE